MYVSFLASPYATVGGQSSHAIYDKNMLQKLIAEGSRYGSAKGTQSRVIGIS